MTRNIGYIVSHK